MGWPVEAVTENVTGLLGYGLDDFVAARLAYADIVHPEDLARVSTEIAEHIELGPDSFRHADYRILHADGSVRWVEGFTVFERDESGEARTAIAFIQDVTARKKTETELDEVRRQLEDLMAERAAELQMGSAELEAADAALRQSEQRLRGAVDSLFEGFAYYDAEDRLVLCNQAFRERNPHADEALENGWTYEDLLRANVKRGALVEARGNEEEFLRERIARHRNPGPPIVRNFADGRAYLVKESRTKDGGTALSFIDITEINDASEALKTAKTEAEEAKALLQDALESTTEAFAIFDEEGRLVIFNEAYRHLYRHSKDLLQIGMSFETMLRERAARGMVPDIGDDAEAWVQWRMGVFTRCEGPVERIFPDGSWWKMNEQRTSTGGVAQVLTDITAIKEREEKLQESEDRFRNLFEHTSIGAAIIGLDGGFRAVNEALCGMLGYSEAEITGMSLLNFAFPEDQTEFIRTLGAYNAGDVDAWPNERRFRRKDGEAMRIEMSAALVRDAKGRPAYLVGHFQDLDKES